MSNKKKPQRPVDMEKRLATAYESGYYDGTVEGIKSTHDLWVHIAERTKGIGPKLQEALISSARIIMAERYIEKFGRPTEDVQEVREEISKGGT